MGGQFPTFNGVARNDIARLNTDGSLDLLFNPNVSVGGGNGEPPQVYSITVQTNGKILVGGNFTVIGGQTRPRLARLNIDATVDLPFNPNPSGGGFGIPLVNALIIQPDGKILVGGRFATVDGQTRNNISRLNADGTADAFNPNANAMVKSLALQTDGKVLMGGFFLLLADKLATILPASMPTAHSTLRLTQM